MPRMIYRLIGLAALLFAFSPELSAQVPSTFMYQGQILQGGTTPLEVNPVIFTVKILSPGAEGCVLYEEQHSINMVGSNGVFSLNIGAGVRSGSNYENSSDLQTVFSNASAFNGLSTCVSGSSYTPVSAHTRKMRISYFDGVTNVTLNQDHHMQATPYSWYANSLQGLSPTNFVQVRPAQNLTQANLENVFGGTNYTSLLSLIAGSSPLYVTSTTGGARMPGFATTPAGATAGSMWYDSTLKQMRFYDGTSVHAVGGDGVGNGTVLEVTAGSGLDGGTITTTGTISVATDGITSTHILDGTVADVDLASGIDASKITTGLLPTSVVPPDPTKLSLSGGTMTGDINMDGHQVLATGHITMSPLSTVTLGKYDAGQQTSLVGALTNVNQGAIWFNSDTSSLMYWDGAAAQIVSNQATAGGDITEVTASAGLTGGGTSGAVSLAVDLGNAMGQLFTIDQVPHCASNQKLEMSNGPVYAWSCETDNDSGGDITEVNTTAPLAGGGTTGALTLTIGYDNSSIGMNGSNQLEVKDGGVAAAKLAADSVITAKIQDAAVTDAKIADVGVDKIASGSGKYFTYMPDNSACTNGQILKWSTADTRWECGDDDNTNLVTSVFGRTGAVVATAGDYTATQITNAAAGNISATTAQAAINELDSEKLALAGGTMTGQLSMGDNIVMSAQNEVRFADSDSSNYVALRSAATVSTNVTWTLPAADGTNGQVLSTNGSGALGWTDMALGDITGVVTNSGSGLSGGATSGDATLQVVVDDATVEIATNTIQVKDAGITAAKLAGDSVTSAKIVDGTIATADIANSAVTDAKIDTMSVGKIISGLGQYFTYMPNNAACTDGQVLKWNNADSRWECGTDDNAGGDITAVNTTAPLSGGGASGALTLSVGYDNSSVGMNGSNQLEVKDAGITAAKLATDSVVTAKIQDGAVTDAKIAAVAVDKIASGVGKYLTYLPNNAACTDGQVLKWNNTDSRWECGSDNDTGDITGVTAGTGLTGGGTSGAVSLAIDYGTGANQVQQNMDIPSCLATQKLQMSAGPTYTWTCETDNDSGGDITAVNTTAPLSGGGTTGALTLTIGYDDSSVGMNGSNQLEVKAGGIAASHLATDSVVTAKIQDAAVTDAKIAAVAVDKIASGVGKYFTYLPNNAACTDGQVLKWNNTDSRWECGDDDNTNLLTSVFGRTGAVTAQAGDYTATQITNTAAGAIASTTVQAAINELDTEKLALAGGTMTGALTMTDNIVLNAQNEVRFADSDSSNYVALRAPASVSSNLTWTLPGADGTSGQVLATDGSGVLSWTDMASGDITGVTTSSGSGLSGGVASGNATLQVVVDDATVEIATNTIQVKDAGITAAKLAGDSVTSAKIVDGTIATADIADSAVTDAKIADVGIDKITSGAGKYLTYLPNNVACTDGQVLKWNNTDTRWECGADDNAGGDITAVTTTAPLAGGGTSGALSLTIGYDDSSVGMNGSNQLEVKAGGVAASHLATDSVVTAKIQDGAVTDAKIAAVAVDKIASGAGKYFTYLPNNAACTDGQVLKWNNTDSRWECGDDDNTNLLTSVFGRTGAVTAQAGDYTATQITNSASGNIAATTVQAAINELDTEKLALAGGTMTGALTMTDNIVLNAQSEVRFADSDSSNYVALRSPASVSSNLTWTLPGADGTSGQVLATDGSGVLSWTDMASGDITGVTTSSGSGLSGGVANGTATLQVVVDDSTVEIATNTIQVKDGGITAAKLAGDSVTSAKIVDGTIATADIANSAVTDAKIADVGIDKITSGAGKYLTYLPNNAACTDGQVLKWNNTDSRWECGADNNDGGDITGVTAGTGLTGGGTSGAVSLAIDYGTGANQVQQNMDIPNCLATQKLQMSAGPTYTWTCETDNDSGGDITAVSTTAPLAGGGTTGALSLTINYDDSSIGLNGSNQLEVKDSGITDAKISAVGVDKITSGAGKYFTYLPNNAACTDGQVLKWNNTDSRWECGNDTDTNTDAVSTVFGRSGTVVATAGDYTATQVTNTAAGNIASTTVQAAINELDTEKLALAGGTLTGALSTSSNITMNAQNEVRFADSDSSNYVALRSAATVGSNVTFTLPSADGTSGQVLSTNGSGALSWLDMATGDITGVTTNSGSGLSGGAASGAATLQVVVDNSTVEIATNTIQVKDGGITDAKIASMAVDKITSGAGKYFTYLPNNAACTDGQVLKWNNTDSRWECGNDTDTNTDAVSTVFGRSGAVVATAGDYTATQITNTAAGNIAATTAQAAINELDTEKLALAGGTLTGALSTSSNITMNAQNEVRFADSDSSNYVAFRSPASVSSNVTWTLPATDGTNGQLLSTNGSGVLSWSDVALGDITGITTSTGSGLSGGATSGTSTLQVVVDNSSIEIATNTIQLKDGGIATGKIADSAVTDAKIASVGVDKITSGAGKYLTYAPNNTACSNGQVLKWSTTNTRWECGTDSDSGDITGVSAGTGLTGGGTSGAISLAIDYGTGANQVQQNMDIPNCLSTQKLEMSAGPVYAWSCVTDANSGGDITAVTTTAPLSGGVSSGAASLTLLYDNTTIGINGSNELEVKDASITGTKIASGTVSSTNILDGTIAAADLAGNSVTSAKIVDGTIATADIADSAVTDAKIASLDIAKITNSSGSYFTYQPNNTACSNGQVLKWSTSNTRWECGSDSDTGDITGVTAGSGLTGGGASGAVTLSVDVGTGASQFFNNSAVPNCSTSEKLQMSAGPVYSLSCIADTTSLSLQDADGDTRITVEAAADEDIIRFRTSGNERMQIDASGFVGIGASPSSERLRVNGDVRLGTSGSNGCVLDAGGGTITGSCSSDARFKKNIQPLGPISEKLSQVAPKFYQWRSGDYPQRQFGNDEQLGLIAQEVLQFIPDLVEMDANGFYRVKYHHIPFYLLQGFAEQHREVSSLKEKINTLEEENKDLKKRLEAIEKMLRVKQ